MDIIKSSIRVIKHPNKKKNNYAVLYFSHYGTGYYVVNKNFSSTKWHGFTKSKAYALAKKWKKDR